MDRPEGPSQPGAGWTAEEDRRAHRDVLNVLAIVAEEYHADPARIFLHGQNPSASAAFHFAAEYPDLFKAIVVSAGPIVAKDYPFEKLAGKVSVMMLHGELDDRNTVAASQRMTADLQAHGITAQYHTVPGGEHLTAYLTYAREIFDFLDAQ